MMRTGTLEGGSGTRRHQTLANGTGFWRTDLIASVPERGWAPQAFLVEQDPDSVILPHFHQRDEFQVVVDGEGTFGRHEVRPISVHYAGRHTGYGPITARGKGLSYFSLRAVADPGARFLPEARNEMLKLPKRHMLAEPVDPAALEVPVKELFPPQPDGLAAWMLRLAPRASMVPPRHGAGGARFYVVLAKDVSLKGERLGRLATVFCAAEERDFEMRAGEAGATILALQFPFESPKAE
jgi:hypothetical protein